MEGTIEALKELAFNSGFSHVRDACAVNKYRAYGTNWSCPPACGTLEECEARIRRFNPGDYPANHRGTGGFAGL